MADEDVEEQQMIGATFEAAIAAIEQHLTVDNDTLSVADFDSAAEDLDGDTVQQLLDSLSAAKEQIATGELAIADFGLKGDANG